MSQRVVYVSRIAGKSKKGKDFDLIKIATPEKMFEPFLVQNGVGDAADTLTEGEEFDAEFEVVSFYGNASIKLVNIS